MEIDILQEKRLVGQKIAFWDSTAYPLVNVCRDDRQRETDMLQCPADLRALTDSKPMETDDEHCGEKNKGNQPPGIE